MFFIEVSWVTCLSIGIFVLLVALVMHVEKIRLILSRLIFKRAVHAIPTLSKTEEEALNAGDTWVEKDIFTGSINWQELSTIQTELTPEEQSFLDNETETLCSMVDEWEVSQTYDLPEAVWTYLREKGFLPNGE